MKLSRCINLWRTRDLICIKKSDRNPADWVTLTGFTENYDIQMMIPHQPLHSNSFFSPFFFAKGVIPLWQNWLGKCNDNVGVAWLAPAQPTQLPPLLTPLEINATLSADLRKKRRERGNLEKELKINCLLHSNNRSDLNRGMNSLEFRGCNDVLFRLFQASWIPTLSGVKL